MKDVVIIYHGNCFDGFGSAWAAWKRFGNAADYFGIRHEQKVLPGVTGELRNKTIYMIDFTFPSSVVIPLMKEAKQVTAIDHHITAEQDVRLTQDYVFDLNHSGAVLAWHYFHPNVSVPKLLLYIEDSDLWRFQLPSSREINAFLRIFKQSFEQFNSIAGDLETAEGENKIIQQGTTILRYKDRLVEQLAERADMVLFEGLQALAINAPTFFASEIAHYLIKKLPPIGIAWSQQQGKKLFSLRSDGSIDVSLIAKKYGGGGHRAAAGFDMDENQPLPWKKIN